MMNVIRRVFGGGQIVVCPRCLERIQTKGEAKEQCSSCAWEVPLQYIRRFNESPPLFMQVFGWSNHGKTMFLRGLQLVLRDAMNRYWESYSYRMYANRDIDYNREVAQKQRQGKEAGATQKRALEQNEVFITDLFSMERWGNRMLVIMDQPGEYFQNFEIPLQEIPFLLNTPTSVMLISLPDMLDDKRNAPAERVDDLLQFYLVALENEGVNFKKERRKLIVVFNKADITPGLPKNLGDYVRNDDIWQKIEANEPVVNPLNGLALAEYLERMERVSEDIKHWISNDTRNVPGGQNFMRVLNQNNLDARFAVISATGGEVENGGVRLSPRRVLDPFFWALEFQSY